MTNTPFVAVRNQGIAELIPEDMKKELLVSKSNKLNLSERILDLKNNPVILHFDEKYNIKNLIHYFLEHLIFDKEKMKGIDKI